MRLSVDHEADALYLTLCSGNVVESEHVAPGVIVDYDGNGQMVGIEVLHLSHRPGVDVSSLVFETVTATLAGPYPDHAEVHVAPEHRLSGTQKKQDKEQRDALAAEGYLFYNAEAREFAEASAQAFADVLAAGPSPQARTNPID